MFVVVVSSDGHEEVSMRRKEEGTTVLQDVHVRDQVFQDEGLRQTPVQAQGAVGLLVKH